MSTKTLKHFAIAAFLTTGLIGFQPLLDSDAALNAYGAQPPSLDIESIIYEDNFNNSESGWRVDSAFGFDWGYAESDGEYRVFLTSPNFIAWADSPYMGSLSNPVVVSADVRHHVTGSLATIGTLGLSLFADDGRIFYFLIIPAHETSTTAATQSYAIWVRSAGGGLSAIAGWTGSSLINDVNEDNALAVVVRDSETVFYINDQPVRAIAGLSINNGGVAGATFSVPNMNARFDNFKISRIEE